MNPRLFDRNDQIVRLVATSSIVVFLILSFLGNYGPKLMTNDKCYLFLGCNLEFFGYDAFVHFMNGIMNTVIIVWLINRSLLFSNLFHERFWKNFLVVFMMIVSIAFLWEFGEFSHDQIRMKIFHENLTNPNTLDQPTNNDTMGDTTFSILGATITFLALNPLIKRKSVTI